MTKEWRPDDWNFVRSQQPEPDVWDDLMLFESGASAMLSVLIAWLDEPCDKHPDYNAIGDEIEHYLFINDSYGVFKHRYLCPQCWVELKESVK